MSMRPSFLVFLVATICKGFLCWIRRGGSREWSPKKNSAPNSELAHKPKSKRHKLSDLCRLLLGSLSSGSDSYRSGDTRDLAAKDHSNSMSSHSRARV